MSEKNFENLLRAVFGKPVDSLVYPCVVEHAGEISLEEVVNESLGNLPLGKGKRDSEPWAREKRIIQLRFGLGNGHRMTLQKIGDLPEFQVAKEVIRQKEARALHRLRRPPSSSRMRKFLVPTPEEIANMREEGETLEDLHAQIERLDEKNRRLISSLRVFGVEEFVTPKSAEGIVRDRRALEIAIEVVASNPESPFYGQKTRWANALKRARIDCLSQLKAMVETGKVRCIRNVGEAGVDFYREVLREAEGEEEGQI